MITELKNVRANRCCIKVEALPQQMRLPAWQQRERTITYVLVPQNLTAKRAIYLYRILPQLEMFAASGILTKSFF